MAKNDFFAEKYKTNLEDLEDELVDDMTRSIDEHILLKLYLIRYKEVGYINYKNKYYKFPGEYFYTDGYVITYSGVPVELKDLRNITKNDVRKLKINRIL